MPFAPLALLLTSFSAATVLFCGISAFLSYPYASADSNLLTAGNPSGLRAFFSFRSPSALFPPSAVISLTDDNSTYFLARPAAFGPPLPVSGLSGQLWVGSGFGDDESTAHVGLTTAAERELGCSDVPDWDDEPQRSMSGRALASTEDTSQRHGQDDGGQRQHSAQKSGGAGSAGGKSSPAADDGTDDYLHDSRRGSSQSPGSGVTTTSGRHAAEHADIQSLQEGAEIAGKVVLLSRGGCGFLEKVKWVQRRGGVALIVSDYTRGRGLVTMYARGDTSNVTIPSLFTSYTTAHLLSSLIPPDRHSGGSALSVSSKSSTRTARADGPTFTPTSQGPAPTSAHYADRAKRFVQTKPQAQRTGNKGFGRIWGLLSIFSSRKVSSVTSLEADSRRPPSSGQLDWVVVDESSRTSTGSSSDSATAKGKSTGAQKTDAHTAGSKGNAAGGSACVDDFIIGVQDWRDRDLLKDHSSSNKAGGPNAPDRASSGGQPVAGSSTLSGHKADATDSGHGGGSSQEVQPTDSIVTPGSGQYSVPNTNEPTEQSPGAAGGSDVRASRDIRQYSSQSSQRDAVARARGNTEHEGLWVTLTPTSLVTSPFFDTLLVLVISPLFTLSVVYVLLLLRSRIRRRRWRAPKSVVERLPVRTYHTIPLASSSFDSPGGSGGGGASSATAGNWATAQHTAQEAASPASPLLLHSRSVAAPVRPSRIRAQTSPDMVAAGEMSRSWPLGAHEQQNFVPVHGGGDAVHASSSSRPSYRSGQVECVVCLEEYVDGVSRVMSLPCGHEFHAECITPWLTTRRRTCPICKGDVVRSLASTAAAATAAPSTAWPGTAYRDEPDVTERQPSNVNNQHHHHHQRNDDGPASSESQGSSGSREPVQHLPPTADATGHHPDHDSIQLYDGADSHARGSGSGDGRSPSQHEN